MSTRSFSSLAAALALTLTVAMPAAQQRAAKPMLVSASRLLDVRAGAYRPSQGIWIEDGRIRQVGALDDVRAAAPKDIVIIDLGRAVVMPGLIDCHAHLLDAMDPAGSSTDNLILTLARESPAFPSHGRWPCCPISKRKRTATSQASGRSWTGHGRPASPSPSARTIGSMTARGRGEN